MSDARNFADESLSHAHAQFRAPRLHGPACAARRSAKRKLLPSQRLRRCASDSAWAAGLLNLDGKRFLAATTAHLRDAMDESLPMQRRAWHVRSFFAAACGAGAFRRSARAYRSAEATTGAARIELATRRANAGQPHRARRRMRVREPVIGDCGATTVARRPSPASEEPRWPGANASATRKKRCRHRSAARMRLVAVSLQTHAARSWPAATTGMLGRWARRSQQRRPPGTGAAAPACRLGDTCIIEFAP